MPQKVRIWEPIHNMGGRYWLEFVVDKREFIKNGNCIKINRIIKFKLRHDKEENKAIDLSFDDIASYRITNESYSDNSIEHAENKEDIKNKLPWSFYTMENSSFIELIEQQSGIPASIYSFKHYHIASMEDVIDIITSSKPIVEFKIDDKIVETNASPATI